MSSSGRVWVIHRIDLRRFHLPFMYQSTIFGTSVRAARAAKAVPIHVRPVTKLEGAGGDSCPAPATPMTTDCPSRDAKPPMPEHHLDVAGAARCSRPADRVGAAFRQVDEIRNQVGADFALD